MTYPIHELDLATFSPSLSTLYADLQELCRIGSRWMGTKGEDEGREFVVERLESAGLPDIRTEMYRYLNYQPRGSKLEIVAPVTEELPSEPLQYSANAVTAGEALFVGEGGPTEIEELMRLGASLENKIVVIKAKRPARAAFQARDRGAAGIVIISDAPEGLIRSTTVSPYPPSLEPPFEGQILPIPGVVTSLPAGERLLKLMTLGRVQLRLEQQGDYAEKTSANVAARVEGSDFPDQVLVVGAHYDTKYAVGGAVDNSTGIAALTEIARHFAQHRPRRSVELVAFSGEEIGLYGSWAYVQQHADELRQHCLGMINMDSLSSALCARHTVAASADWLRDLGVGFAKRMSWPVDSILELNNRDYRIDAVPFIDLGLPTIFITQFTPDFENPYYHTARDLIETIDPFKLRRLVQLIGTVADHLANADDPRQMG